MTENTLAEGSRTLPADVTAAEFAAAHLGFIEAIGDEWVMEEPGQLSEFGDPYAPLVDPDLAPSLVLQPGTVEEIQAVVRIANTYRIPLWTNSQGRNNGYGGSAPRVNGSVVLNLRRMNRVLEVNEESGYAVVEPGVSFQDLNDYLVANGHKLWTDVPDLSWGSVLGNTLEHGIGYTPYGEHADQVCGMEVVLANGDIVRTGMGAQSNSRNFHTHPRGFGPRLDQMFMQSNFGIVASMGLWLMPQPVAWRAVWIHCEGNEDAYAIIDALRPLLLDNTISNRVTIMSLMAFAMAATKKADWYDGEGSIPEEIQRVIAKEMGLGLWNVRIGLYGEPEIMDVQQRLIQNAISGIPGARLVSREYPGDVPQTEVFPPDKAMAGMPSMDLLGLLNWNGDARGGHLGFGPIAPLSGADGRQLIDLVSRHAKEMGRDFGAGFALTARSMQLVALIVFDADDPAAVNETKEHTAQMIREAAALGYGEYRGHLDFMDLINEQFDFNDHAARRLNETIKDALDPNGILAPGKQGIWPLSHTNRPSTTKEVPA